MDIMRGVLKFQRGKRYMESIRPLNNLKSNTVPEISLFFPKLTKWNSTSTDFFYIEISNFFFLYRCCCSREIIHYYDVYSAADIGECSLCM